MLRATLPQFSYENVHGPVDREYYLRLLRAADDPVYAEMPGPPYRRDADQERFEAFAADVSAILKVDCRVETGADIQDASFIGQIEIPDAFLYRSEGVWIRVSYLGNFIATFDDDEVEENALKALQDSASSHGYFWIPTAILGEAYTGKNRGVSGFANWWDRYFDWI